MALHQTPSPLYCGHRSDNQNRAYRHLRARPAPV